MFEYASYTQRTMVNIPANYMLKIPEDLSYQLGMEGHVYMGPWTKGPQTTDFNYRNHSVYICTDLIKDWMAGDKRAPPNLKMQTIDFPHLLYHPMRQTCFRQVSVCT